MGQMKPLFLHILRVTPHSITKKSLREKCPYSEFFWSVFSRIRTEYGNILRISSYSVRMQENRDQKYSEYGHFSRSELDVRFPFPFFHIVFPLYLHCESVP